MSFQGDTLTWQGDLCSLSHGPLYRVACDIEANSPSTSNLRESKGEAVKTFLTSLPIVIFFFLSVYNLSLLLFIYLFGHTGWHPGS